MIPTTEAFTLLQPYSRTRIVSPKLNSGLQASSYDHRLLISFDLDDTLFPINETVYDANAAQIAYMQTNLKVDTNLDQFLQTTRQIRQELKEKSNDGTSKTTTYTNLRKLAIRQEIINAATAAKEAEAEQDDSLVQQLVQNESKLNQVVDETFDVWLKERHDAANRYLFDDAIDMLESIQGENVCIAAITNGRGNPLEMNRLEQYFDFCISGEDDNVFPYGKPHAGIYQRALEKYQEIIGSNNDNNVNKDNDFTWIHVGDCLANDVGASANVGALAVWYDPSDDSDDNNNNKEQQWSTASAEEIEKRNKLKQQAQEKVAVQISNLSELPGAIESLLATASVGAKNPKEKQVK